MAEKVMEIEGAETTQVERNLKERKGSWERLRRVDSLDLEARKLSVSQSHASKVPWKMTLSLAFQSLGVVYGDIGTSPLYVFSSTFPDKIGHHDDVLGVLSLIIYTIVLIPMIKYVFIVLRANDNGDGGTFALYSLLCRYAKVSLMPNQQPEDRDVSNYRLEIPSNPLKRAQKIREKLENSKTAQLVLFLVTIAGTSMVIGDGILTPSISVLSAVSGIKSLGQDAVVGISVAILIAIFSVQRFGTDKVGFTFAPIILLWFALIGGTGLYNLFKHNVAVLRAFNPMYIIDYFRRNGKKGWISLGGVLLSITGTEAMFADLGHFNIRAIQVSFSCITFPAIIATYCGQAAYLTKFPDHVSNTFYESVPGSFSCKKDVIGSALNKLIEIFFTDIYADPIYWPTFVIAVAATIIASQAMISGAFSIVCQSLSLGCFPRVQVVHTSAAYEGQVYIPEINYMLMIACVVVSVAFRTTENIGHAYGIAVVCVMLITTFLVTLIMLVIWKTNILWIGLFLVIFGSIDLLYLSAVLYKFTRGGFLPLVFSAFLMAVMGIWHYVHRRRYMFELRNKVSSDYIQGLATNPNISRVPGIGLLYSELVQGIPPIFPHFIANIPSIHSIVVFVSIKSIPVSKVVPEERFLFRCVGPRDYRMFRCIARYGYNDKIREAKEFEHQLVEELKEFIRHEQFMLEGDSTAQIAEPVDFENSSILVKDKKPRGSSRSTIHIEESLEQPVGIQSFNAASVTNSSSRIIPTPILGVEEEMKFLQTEMENGVVYLLGEAEVVAEKNSSFFKKIVVNYVYSFLRKNFRQGEEVMAIPRSRLLRVGMTYEI